MFLTKVKATLIEMIWNDSKNKNLKFLKEILDNLAKEIDVNFWTINRKCRDNIHYGFYNEIEEDEYKILERNQDIYLSYIIQQFDGRISYVFDDKYNRNIEMANFLYKVFNNN